MKKISGIYAILAPNGRIYIGSSANVRIRWTQHVNALKRGDHSNAPLQRTYDKYRSGFVFTLLETCAIAELIVREQAHIDSFDFSQLLNVAVMADSPTRGREVPDATRAKMRRAALGRTHSSETRAKMRGTREYSEAVCAHVRNLAARARGKSRGRMSDAQRAKLSDSQRRVSASGFRGVYKHGNAWRALVNVDSVQRNLGTYATPTLAAAMRFAYIAALDHGGCPR